jgi:hypothetical protein
MSLADDIRAAMKAIKGASPRPPTATVHHPKCPAVESGDASKCRCGGVLYPR